MYRVFLGAPPPSSIDSTDGFHWQTVSSSEQQQQRQQQLQPTPPLSAQGSDAQAEESYMWPTKSASSARPLQPTPPLSAPDSNGQESYMWPMRSASSAQLQVHRGDSSARLLQRGDSFMYPPATLEAASRRISLIYKNAIFERTGLELEEPGDELNDGVQGGDMTTLISWPPTNPADEDASRAVRGRGSISFLRRADSQDDSIGSMAPPPLPKRTDANTSAKSNANANAMSDSGVFESQETQSFDYSDASSIARFPTFHFDIHALSSLALVSKGPAVRGRKVNLLLAIVEVDGPESITIRNGKDAGKRVGLLKLVLADEGGCVGKLTAWREVAEEWGGIGKSLGCKRGDVVHLETSSFKLHKTRLTASPNLKSKMTICYRTMPHAHEDGVFRPDLRLGESDPCVRKVASVVRWFEGMAGLPGDCR